MSIETGLRCVLRSADIRFDANPAPHERSSATNTPGADRRRAQLPKQDSSNEMIGDA
jgi:hypothetical protein